MEYSLDPAESVSEGVKAAVRDFRGRADEPLEPISMSLDPDALDAIFHDGEEGPRAEGRVSFTYGPYVVTVEHNEYIEIR